MQDVKDLLKQPFLGTQEQIELVLELLHDQKYLSKKDLLKYCGSKIYGIKRSFNGIIALLDCTEFIEIEKKDDDIFKDVKPGSVTKKLSKYNTFSKSFKIMSVKRPIREGKDFKNHICATGEASSM